ncbi:unnamed protein product [Owenia fusiformis]|uniref:Uncharacterized protein n=1 Tax=Owenia fusiformis TaxID=6347 RepID=A0A8S4NP99_OWEFU|nr:unnamed protein product [Owenia fusiformis]
MKSVLIVCLLAIVVLAAEANLEKKIFKREEQPYRITKAQFKEYLNCSKDIDDVFYKHLEDGAYNVKWADICPYADYGREVLRNESIRHECDTEEIIVFYDEHVSGICDHVLSEKVWFGMECEGTGDFDYRPSEFDDAPEKICENPQTVIDIGCRVLKEAKDRECNKESLPHIGMGVAIFNQVYCHKGDFAPIDLMEKCQQSGGSSGD